MPSLWPWGLKQSSAGLREESYFCVLWLFLYTSCFEATNLGDTPTYVVSPWARWLRRSVSTTYVTRALGDKSCQGRVVPRTRNTVDQHSSLSSCHQLTEHDVLDLQDFHDCWVSEWVTDKPVEQRRMLSILMTWLMTVICYACNLGRWKGMMFPANSK